MSHFQTHHVVNSVYTAYGRSKLLQSSDTGAEDVAIFDFTSMYSAEHAAKIYSKKGHTLIVGLVGDGLMEVHSMYN